MTAGRSLQAAEVWASEVAPESHGAVAPDERADEVDGEGVGNEDHGIVDAAEFGVAGAEATVVGGAAERATDGSEQLGSEVVAYNLRTHSAVTYRSGSDWGCIRARC